MILYILCVSFIEDYLEWTGICARNSLVRKSSDQTQPFHKQTEHRTSWHSRHKSASVCRCITFPVFLPSWNTLSPTLYLQTKLPPPSTNAACPLYLLAPQPALEQNPMHEPCISQQKKQYSALITILRRESITDSIYTLSTTYSPWVVTAFWIVWRVRYSELEVVSTYNIAGKLSNWAQFLETCFLGKLQAFTMRENYGKLSNCQKCNQASVEFFPPLLFQGTREEGGKE